MSINLHSSKHSQLASFSMKTLSAAVLSAVLCTSAYAAGMGKLTVLSSLGQPLRAEIELTSVAKEEAGTIVAKLASAEAYRQANIEFNPALFSLRFAIENRGERHFIRVTSAQPINEPFVAMLLELGGTNNRLVREYTFLLDPADLRMGPSTQVAATPGSGARAAAAGQAPAVSVTPVPQPEATQQAIRESRAAARASRSAAATAAPAATAAAGGDAYQVKKGDTLAEIAGQVKPEGVSLDQMLVALYRANTSAFVANNMNRLRAGQILTVPDADAAKAIGKSEARGVIVAQAADFNAYRNQLAGQVASSAQPKTAQASQSAGGKITTQVEEKTTAVTESKDKLKLSKADAAAKAPGSGATSTTGIAAGTEELIAKEKALAEANSRVKELEKNVTDLQKLLEIKNKDLAAQQAQAAATAKAATAPVAAPEPAVPPAAAPDAQPSQAATPGNEAAPVEKPAEPVAEAPVAAPEQPVAKPKAKPVVVPPLAVEEPSFLDDLLGNTVLLAGLGAGLLAGLGGLGFYRMRRKKQAAQYDDSILADSSLKANSLFGSTGGQSVDTSNSVFNSSFAPAVSQLDANEVDPVAEADVYIAYGRDAQAEEILKEALRTQPERHAVRLKLLEIYSGRKDLRAFETVATELYSMTKGEGDDWAQAATMGAALDPNNPLYAGAKAQEIAGGTAAALTAATLPQHDDLDALLGSTDQQLSTLGALDGMEANSAYFDNSVLSDLPPAEPVQDPAPQAAEEAPSANGLDFDLDGLNLQVPDASPAHAAPAESAGASDLDFASMDFGLEQDPHAASPELDAPTAMSVEVGGDDLAFMPVDVPSLPEEAPPQSPASAEATTLNFDLSDISLDLNPGEGKAARTEQAVSSDTDLGATLDFSTADTKLNLTQSLPSFDLPQDNFENSLVLDSEEAASTPDSEMATKLDLAIAYQEIGDREGARELLDEVIKGGNADQSEKAKSLLMSLA